MSFYKEIIFPYILVRNFDLLFPICKR